MTTPHITNQTHDTRIAEQTPLPSPARIKADFPLTEESWTTIAKGRKTIPDILHCRDPRLLVIMGPCSIHDEEADLEYARRLAALANQYRDRLYVVMRTCCGKPRTRPSWLGFYNDWKMDGSQDILEGWRRSRKLMLEITRRGLPVGFEYLDPEDHQNDDDLPSYLWIGARSTQTQKYKQFASGLSTACGFKNPTSGLVNLAVEAIEFAKHPHVFSAPDNNGIRTKFRTTGNADCHLILRGSDAGPNYDQDSVEAAALLLRKHDLTGRVIIDASHGNSEKNHLMQEKVIRDVVRQIKLDVISERVPLVAGIMWESFINDGCQPLDIPVTQPLQWGVSVTDGCDGLERTERILKWLYEELAWIS